MNIKEHVCPCKAASSKSLQNSKYNGLPYCDAGIGVLRGALCLTLSGYICRSTEIALRTIA